MLFVKSLLCTFIFISLSVHGQQPRKLLVTLDSLKILSNQENATNEQLALSFLNIQRTQQLFKDNFTWTFNAETTYSDTKEKSFHPFMPPTGPVKSLNLGLMRKTLTGIEVGLNTYTNQFTNGFTKHGTSSGVGVNLVWDLHKDFFGRLTQAQGASLLIGTEKARLERNYGHRVFQISLAKIYWGIVATDLSTKIAQKLLLAATQQAEDAQKRQNNSLADSGEVARYEAQVAARKAQILALKNQYNTYVRQLKELIPKLNLGLVEIGPYSIEQVKGQVISCARQIGQYQSVPLKFSPHSKILALSNKQFEYDQAVANSHADWDLKLKTNLEVLGKDNSYGDSFSNLYDYPREKFQVGLQLTIPIGGQKENTQLVLQNIEKRKINYEKQKIISQLSSYHAQTVLSVGLLNQVIQQQKINSERLAHSLSVAKKKFKQARINVRDLINDQDLFLQSELAQIETQLQIIYTLLDYFSVFTDFPCDLNFGHTTTQAN